MTPAGVCCREDSLQDASCRDLLQGGLLQEASWRSLLQAGLLQEACWGRPPAGMPSVGMPPAGVLLEESAAVRPPAGVLLIWVCCLLVCDFGVWGLFTKTFCFEASLYVF